MYLKKKSASSYLIFLSHCRNLQVNTLASICKKRHCKHKWLNKPLGKSRDQHHTDKLLPGEVKQSWSGRDHMETTPISLRAALLWCLNTGVHCCGPLLSLQSLPGHPFVLSGPRPGLHILVRNVLSLQQRHHSHCPGAWQSKLEAMQGVSPNSQRMC